MSEFLMIVPEGWLEINSPESTMSEESWLNANPWEVTEALKSIGIIEEGYESKEYRVFRDDGILRLWVLVGPEQ
jgi:hypothetical protein